MNTPIILANNQESLKKWDHFVLNHNNGWLTQHSTWAEVLSRCYKNVFPYRLALVNSNNGEITAGLSLFLVKSLITGKKLIAVPMATIHDPLVNSEYEFNALLQAAVDLKLKTESKCLKIKTFNSNKFLKSSNFSDVKVYLSHVLSLENDLQEIWKAFDRTCIRQNIRKLEKYKIKFRIASGYSDLDSFFGLYRMTRRLHGLPSLPKDFFRAIFDIYGPKKNSLFILDEYNSIPIASVLIFIFKNRCSAEALGWDIRYKWLSPSTTIFWEAIKIAYNSGCRWFDFGRTAPANRSLIDFKRRWGTEEIEIPVYAYSSDRTRKSLIQESGLARKFANIVFRDSPSPIYNSLSNLFYRHYLE
ncbi:MAG: GNAT family N-acetyltransferase [Candidatus Aminicenantes bacterium]|nr:GNAT family N-acetyltransferase [Candidatus Aminicenantes bacterium]